MAGGMRGGLEKKLRVPSHHPATQPGLLGWGTQVGGEGRAEER